MRARSLLVLCFALAGCEALFGIRETSGGSGGSTASGPNGGQAPAGGGGAGSGASGPTGSGGSTTTGGGGGNGGSGGAACDGGVTPAFFCNEVSMSDFCADFDGDSGSYDTGWDALNQVGSSTSAALDTNVSHSPNGSFRVDGTYKLLDTHCSDGQEVTRLPHPISTGATGVQVDFWYRRSGDLPMTSTGSVQNLDVNCDPGGSGTYGILGWGMRHGFYGVETYSSANSKSGSKETIAAPPVDTWIHVHVELTFATHGKVVIYHDCTNVYEDDDVDTTCTGSNVKTLLIGMLTCSEVPAASVWFDDVVVAEEM